MTFGRLLLLFPPSGNEHTFSIHVTSHSIVVTWEIKVTASVNNVFTRGKRSAGRDFNGE